MELEDQAHQAKYRELRAKIAQDMSSMTSYHAKNDENKRRGHVVTVMHERAQTQIGRQYLAYGHILCFICYPCVLKFPQKYDVEDKPGLSPVWYPPLPRLCEDFMEKTCRVLLAADKSPVEGPALTMAKNLALSKKATISKCLLPSSTIKKIHIKSSVHTPWNMLMIVHPKCLLPSSTIKRIHIKSSVHTPLNNMLMIVHPYSPGGSWRFACGPLHRLHQTRSVEPNGYQHGGKHHWTNSQWKPNPSLGIWFESPPKWNTISSVANKLILISVICYTCNQWN